MMSPKSKAEAIKKQLIVLNELLKKPENKRMKSPMIYSNQNNYNYDNKRESNSRRYSLASPAVKNGVKLVGRFKNFGRQKNFYRHGFFHRKNYSAKRFSLGRRRFKTFGRRAVHEVCRNFRRGKNFVRHGQPVDGAKNFVGLYKKFAARRRRQK